MLIGSTTAIVRVILEHDSIQQEMARQARSDPLTGLLNRRAFLDEAARRIDRLEREGLPGTLMFVDLDNFKSLNDRHGHDRGDEVIIAVADALCTNDVFTVRLGGEEFALLLYGAAPLETVDALLRLLPHFVTARVAGLEVPVTASAGVANVSTDMTVSAALKAADIRLYAAKAAGRNQLVGSAPSAIAPRVA
jgi:diguanylate cyclase (GGDEF)-like protein